MFLLILKFIRRIFKLLNKDISPSKIGLGLLLGMWLGLAPLNLFYAAIIILLFLVFRGNFTAVLLGFATFKPLSLLFINRISKAIGQFFLDSMPEFWQSIAGTPILSWLNLNESHVLGGILLGSILTFPINLLIHSGIEKYRSMVEEESRHRILRIVRKFWIVRFIKWIFIGPNAT